MDDVEIERKVKEDDSRRCKQNSSSEFQSLVKTPDHLVEFFESLLRVPNKTRKRLRENTESFPEEPLNMVSKSSLENKCVLQLQRIETTEKSQPLTIEDNNKTDSQTQFEDSI